MTEKGVEREIKESDLKNHTVSLSASESLCFIRYLGLMIGDLIIDTNNKNWKLYLMLREIVHILLSPRFLYLRLTA